MSNIDLTIKVDHKIGDLVYCITDNQQLEMIVVGYNIRPNNLISYVCAQNGLEASFYSFELSKQKNILKGLN